ncbi:MAG: DUF4129 domain-containing protein [Thaumarchaeota archaeon]|nr:DUF4129 domain-containing protein [Nitrososphaerota archaeon]
MLALFPLLVLFAFYSSLNVAATNGPIFKLGNFSQPPNNFFVATTNHTLYTFTINNTNLFSQPNNFFSSVSIPPAYVFALIAILFSAVVLGMVRNIQRQRRISAFEVSEGTKAMRAEVIAVLDDAVSRLQEGSNYRETILECYRRISQVIESKIAFDSSSKTPREFKIIASERLQFRSSYLSQVTDLFELARYSQHEITKGEAEAAMDCFSNLKADLVQERD